MRRAVRKPQPLCQTQRAPATTARGGVGEVVLEGMGAVEGGIRGDGPGEQGGRQVLLEVGHSLACIEAHRAGPRS